MIEPRSEIDELAVGRLPHWLAVLLVFCTSAAVLVLEILAGRLLAPYIGVSLNTFTGIIGTILAGIAVGAWAGGRLADRYEPTRLLAPMLVVGGALAISTIPVVRAVGESGGTSDGLGIIVVTAVGFMPAAIALSAVPPTVVKAELRDLAVTGATVGRLSAWGTAGAIVGTFFTGYVLVASARVTVLIVGTGLALIAAGAALWFWFRRPGDRSGRDMLAGGSLALLAFGGVAVTESPCELQTAYYCVDVVVDPERPGGRVLVLDDLTHSYVDLDDPTHLEFWYVRRLVGVIDRVAGESENSGRDLDLVHIGGGGLTIPAREQAIRPDSRQIVLEIDADLLDFVADRLGFDPSPLTDLRVGDARLQLARLADDTADIVIGDAFGGRAVPFHLTTTEFLSDVERVLRPNGVYAANVIDGRRERFLRAEVATLLEVFDHVALIRGPVVVAGRRGNSVVVAGNVPLDTAKMRSAIDFEGGELLIGDDVESYVAGADVLTDDFAPVDQYLTG